MRHLLIDTHVLLWFLLNDGKIKPAISHIQQSDHIYVSLASLWEIAIKIGLKKLDLDYGDLIIEINRICFEILDINIQHINKTMQLPFYHRDPFDRMLIAQSLGEEIPLLTHDQTLAQYSDFIIVF